jgi:hypothetical protein
MHRHLKTAPILGFALAMGLGACTIVQNPATPANWQHSTGSHQPSDPNDPSQGTPESSSESTHRDRRAASPEGIWGREPASPTQPGRQPGATDPGRGRPDPGSPGATDPGRGRPDTGSPGATDPGRGRPDTGSPGATDPGRGRPGASNPSEPANPRPPNDKDSANPPVRTRADGAACSTGDQCRSGICEGMGCGPNQGRCMPTQRACTRDLQVYCGCDGLEFRASGSCPGRVFLHPGACAPTR